MSYRFSTKCLEAPKPMPIHESKIDKNDIEQLCAEDENMGRELDAIFDLIDGKARQQFLLPEVVVEHVWNSRTCKFE